MRYRVDISGGDRERLISLLESFEGDYKKDLANDPEEEDRIWLRGELSLTSRLRHQIESSAGYAGASVAMQFTTANKEKGSERQWILDELARDLGGSVVWWDEVGFMDIGAEPETERWEFKCTYEFSAEWEAKHYLDSLDASKFDVFELI